MTKTAEDNEESKSTKTKKKMEERLIPNIHSHLSLRQRKTKQ